MAAEQTTLAATRREIAGSRANRRLRRTGHVPVVLYGGGAEPEHLAVNARELRRALQSAGAVVELAVDGQGSTAVVKDMQRHPVRGEVVHIDFVRVRMDVAIQSTVVLDLTGSDDAPGIKAGGVLELQLRDLAVEGLPGDLPEAIHHDVSHLEAGATLHISDLTPPPGIALLDDPETVVASITLPRLELEPDDDVETEPEIVGGEAAGGDAKSPPDTTSE